MRSISGGDYLLALAPLDSTDPAPLYQQIGVRIADAVHARRLRQGQHISVGAIARRYHMSMETAHRALRVAADQGAVRLVHGVGAFVRTPAGRGESR